MQNHFHTDAVQLGITALAVIAIMQFIRVVSAQMADSGTPLIATIGKGAGGLVTFSGS